MEKDQEEEEEEEEGGGGKRGRRRKALYGAVASMGRETSMQRQRPSTAKNKERREETTRDRESRGNRGRDWRHATTSHGMLRITGDRQKSGGRPDSDFWPPKR